MNLPGSLTARLATEPFAVGLMVRTSWDEYMGKSQCEQQEPTPSMAVSSGPAAACSHRGLCW